jgi:hypothetical protein
VRLRLDASELLRLKDAQLVAQAAEFRLELARHDLASARDALAGTTSEILARRGRRLPRSASLAFEVSGPHVTLIAGKMQEPGGKAP